MSTPWTTISRSPLALSMRMSVLAPGQPTAVRTSLRGGRLMTRAARCCGSLEDPAVDLEHLGELAADVDAAREGDVAAVSYTHLRAHETDSYLVCRLLLEKKKT